METYTAGRFELTGDKIKSGTSNNFIRLMEYHANGSGSLEYKTHMDRGDMLDVYYLLGRALGRES